MGTTGWLARVSGGGQVASTWFVYKLNNSDPAKLYSIQEYSEPSSSTASGAFMPVVTLSSSVSLQLVSPACREHYYGIYKIVE